jgi:hypothetical protein
MFFERFVAHAGASRGGELWCRGAFGRGMTTKLTAACPLLHMHAAPSPYAMPPLARRDVRNIVRKLGAGARPSQQMEAAKMIAGLADDGAATAAIVSAGAIPPLVQLLGPGASSAEVPYYAAASLSNLAQTAELAATIAAAGAVPLLVQLLGPGSTAEVQRNAALALCNLAQLADIAATIAAAGAIPPLVQLVGPGSDGITKRAASGALNNVGYHNADICASIAAAASSAGLLREMERLGIN